MIKSHQIRAARAMLKWSALELAHKSEISWPTIQKIEEDEDGAGKTSAKNLIKIQNVLQESGIEFLEGGAVRLKASS